MAVALSSLNPRIRIALLAIWTIGVFAVDSPVALMAIAAIALLAAAYEGVGLRRAAATIFAVTSALLVLAVVSSFRFDGSGDVVIAQSVGLSSVALGNGLVSVARICAVASMCLAAAGSSGYGELLDAFCDLLAPLSRFHVPVDDLASIATVGLRFIPAFRDQVARVVDAQRSRGAGFDTGGPWKRVRAWAGVLTPVVIGLFRHADDLSCAMTARRWRKTGRTRLYDASPGNLDWAALVIGTAACIAVAVVF